MAANERRRTASVRTLGPSKELSKDLITSRSLGTGQLHNRRSVQHSVEASRLQRRHSQAATLTNVRDPRKQNSQVLCAITLLRSFIKLLQLDPFATSPPYGPSCLTLHLCAHSFVTVRHRHQERAVHPALQLCLSGITEYILSRLPWLSVPRSRCTRAPREVADYKKQPWPNLDRRVRQTRHFSTTFHNKPLPEERARNARTAMVSTA
jgi:hypothetical protein